MIKPDLDEHCKSALSYYIAGRNYMFATQMILGSPEYPSRSDGMTLPVYGLAAFSLEMFLKSYLASKGIPEKDLRTHQVGHNLELLHAKALEHGLPADGLRGTVVGMLHKHHFANEFRYMPLDVVFNLPPPAALTFVLTALDPVISAAINAPGLIVAT